MIVGKNGVIPVQYYIQCCLFKQAFMRITFFTHELGNNYKVKLNVCFDYSGILDKNYIF